MPLDIHADERGAAPAGGLPDPEFPPERLDHLFTFHRPKPDQIPKYEEIRAAAYVFAEILIANCPPGADRSAAIRKVREAVMTANAAIALRGRE